MKLKKYRSIENEEQEHSTWCTERAMEINTINRLQKWDCLM